MTFFYPLSYTQKPEEKIMKNFILKIFALIVVLATLTACGGGNVSSVKNGVFDDYQGTTVGDAFDNWNICESTSWSEFQTENGRNIVEYRCAAAKTGYSSLIAVLETLDVEDTESAMCVSVIWQGLECNFTVERMKQTLKDGITYLVQFQINLDDSFETTYLGAFSPKVGEIDLTALGLITIDELLSSIMSNDIFINDVTPGGPVELLASNIALNGDMDLLNL